MSTTPPSSPNTAKKLPFVRDRPTYDALVEAYRLVPGNYRGAARITGMDRRVCKNAWERGWIKAGVPWALPIRDVLAAEKDRARAEASERAAKDRDLEDAARVAKRKALEETLAQEQELMGENRRGLLVLSKTVARLAGVMPAFAKVVQDSVTYVDPLTNEVKPLDGLNGRGLPTITAMQAAKIIRDMSSISNRLAYAATAMVELARLDRGQSTSNVTVVESDDPQELLEELAAGATLYDRLRTRDLPPGLGSTPDDDLGDGPADDLPDNLQ